MPWCVHTQREVSIKREIIGINLYISVGKKASPTLEDASVHLVQFGPLFNFERDNSEKDILTYINIMHLLYKI